MFGHLATAVISATVRDVLREENVPVSVQYTLSTVKLVWDISVRATNNLAANLMYLRHHLFHMHLYIYTIMCINIHYAESTEYLDYFKDSNENDSTQRTY